MRKLFIASLLMLAASTAWADCTPGHPCSVAPSLPGNSHIPVAEATYRELCMANFSYLATEKLHMQLHKDKAVTAKVLESAVISENKLGDSCASVCSAYASLAHNVNWAHVSVGYISEPEHTKQKIFGAMKQPAQPGATELNKCLPQQATMNWCPQSGLGVGAGPSRIENPLDKIKVCITGGDALKNMNFSEADIARNCARPAIVDAAERIKVEHKCVTDAVKSEEKIKQAAADKVAAEKAAKAVADKAAAYGSAQLPNGNIGMSAGARKKP